MDTLSFAHVRGGSYSGLECVQRVGVEKKIGDRQSAVSGGSRVEQKVDCVDLLDAVDCESRRIIATVVGIGMFKWERRMS